jgi:hypothetical protein
MPATSAKPNSAASKGPRKLKPAERQQLLVEAANLINPVSDLANDYLNHFNEVLLLIENLPVLLPEMVDELLTWQPASYRTYFERSPLPGGHAAIALYDNLDAPFRELFESRIAAVNALALAATDIIRAQQRMAGELQPQDIEILCERMSVALRGALAHAADLVNHGRRCAVETPQTLADRLMATAAPDLQLSCAG